MIDVTEINAETGEVVERDYTAEEQAQREADAIADAAAAAERQAAEAARVKSVQDAQAELKALGLSDSAIETISGHPYPYSPAA